MHIARGCSFCLFAIVIAFASFTAHGAEQTPSDIIENMRNAYSKLTSYSDTGIVNIVVSMVGQQQILTKPFAITFKRPDSIRIEWTDSFAGVPTPYVLWNGTNGIFSYAQRMNQLGKKYDSLAQAIGSQSGSSGGSTARVPDLLLRVLKVPIFSHLSDLTHGGIETVDGVECHKLSGVQQGKPIDLWIAKTDFLLHKLRISTPFGDITETHQNVKINEIIEDTAVSFTPPLDVEHVDKFDVRKNLKR